MLYFGAEPLDDEARKFQEYLESWLDTQRRGYLAFLSQSTHSSMLDLVRNVMSKEELIHAHCILLSHRGYDKCNATADAYFQQQLASENTTPLSRLLDATNLDWSDLWPTADRALRRVHARILPNMSVLTPHLHSTDRSTARSAAAEIRRLGMVATLIDTENLFGNYIDAARVIGVPSLKFPAHTKDAYMTDLEREIAEDNVQEWWGYGSHMEEEE